MIAKAKSKGTKSIFATEFNGPDAEEVNLHLARRGEKSWMDWSRYRFGVKKFEDCPRSRARRRPATGTEYGRAKHQLCVAERGFGFDFGARIRSGETIDVDVSRAEDGEPRFRTIGIIEGVAFAVVWTPRNDSRRILSARRASRKERKSL